MHPYLLLFIIVVCVVVLLKKKAEILNSLFQFENPNNHADYYIRYSDCFSAVGFWFSVDVIHFKGSNSGDKMASFFNSSPEPSAHGEPL